MPDILTTVLIGMIAVLGLVIYVGFAWTLGAGEYEVAWGKEWIWGFYLVSLGSYLISAAAAIGFSAYGIASIAMALSLFSDYVIGWAVGDDVVLYGGNKGFVGVKYTAFVSKTILLPMMAYMAGISGSGKKYLGTESRFASIYDKERGKKFRDSFKK